MSLRNDVLMRPRRAGIHWSGQCVASSSACHAGMGAAWIEYAIADGETGR